MHHKAIRPVALVASLLLLLVPDPILTLTERHPVGTSTAAPYPAAPRVDDGSNWSALHEALVSEARALAESPSGVDLVLYGDSITESARGTSSGTDCCPENRAAYLHALGNHFTARALGIAGDRTPQLLWRIQNGELGTLQPRVVVVLIGTNDLGFAAVCKDRPTATDCAADPESGNITLAAERAAATIEQIVDRLLQAGTQTRVLLQAVLPRGTDVYTLPNIFTAPTMLLNQRLRAIAETKPHVNYVDCGTDFVTPGGEAVVESFMPDALHPGAAGSLLMYQCLACAIRHILRHPQAADRHDDLTGAPCCHYKREMGWHPPRQKDDGQQRLSSTGYKPDPY